MQVLTDKRFTDFALDARLQSALAALNFEHLTPIQALTLPHLLEGHDVVGQAQTGTGKTCAFLLAVFQRLLALPPRAERNPAHPRALILAPTRELAVQIHRDAIAIGRDSGLAIRVVFGGVDYEKQRREIESGVDVLIGTPGRALDYLRQGVYGLREVEIFVLDEADRMFDLGFIKDIRFVLRRLPAKTERQGLLFSATFGQRVRELAYEHFNTFVELAVQATTATADRIAQSVYFPGHDEKLRLLSGLLATQRPPRSIVFVNTRSYAERVRDHLAQQGWKVGLLSGDVPQAKRLKLLDRFKAGEVEVLVATDVAARGLHIPEVSHIFNFDLPQDPEDYVHRVGRTARLGASGEAISFACESSAVSLPDIEAFVGLRLKVEPITAELLAARRQPASTDLADATSADAARPARRRRRGRSAPVASGG